MKCYIQIHSNGLCNRFLLLKSAKKKSNVHFSGNGSIFVIELESNLIYFNDVLMTAVRNWNKN